ncbi:MAG: rod shape-determining protein RodA [Acidimicrobiales bacterium]
MALSIGRSTQDLSRRDLSRRRDLSAPWRHIDLVLVVATVALAAMGTLMVFSATKGSGDVADTTYLKRELLWMVVGLGAMAGVALFDYRRLLDWVWPIYGLSLLALVLVVSPLGQRSKGAQAWFGFGAFQLQPAEFAKLALIIALAALLSAYEGHVDLRRLGILLGVAGAPMLLIMLQPDLGMVLIFLAVLMVMLLVGGVRGRYLLALLLIGVVATFGVLNSSVLKQYQKDRLTAFINPANDTQGATYNVNQSQTAIGAGGVAGQGLFNGRQTQLRFVPEQQTDFIFTVVGEELGFVGASVVLGLYATILWRVWRAAALARDRFGQLLCAGVLAFFLFQVFENVGMAMGIMPVTGIPLPFLSYGGTSIVTSFIGVGLVLSVHMRRFR